MPEPTKLPLEPAPTEAEIAAQQARMNFLRSQAEQFMNNVRGTKLALLMADNKGELAEDLKNWLYGEFIQCAGICEVKK